FQAWNVSRWVKGETRPPMREQAVQLLVAKDYADRLRMPPFPPLYPLSIGYAMSRPDPARAALWANAGYMALLLLALWGLGAHFGGPWVGFATALLFSCAPELQRLQSTQLLDLALIAVVAAAYWALLLSERFARWGPSLAFGALFAAAMLTKWSAFSYFFPAYWLAAQAMADRSRRPKALAAALLAVVLAAPWYVVELPFLLPRLVDASADQAVSLFTVSGFFSYPLQLIYGLETPLLILGVVALVAPAVERRKDDFWLPLAWLGTSLVFWMIVPNRQLRYLLPAVAPLALAAAATWPRGLVAALCAYQLAAAANFSAGWVRGAHPVIGIPVNFFRSEPPKAEAWPLDDILSEASRLHRDPPAFGGMVVVANHGQLNYAGLTWEERRLGIGNLRMREVNRRLCELAEFVLVKTGSLGPDGVIDGLPAARDQVLDPKGWFRKAYREAKRWPLPDGSEALLFARADPAVAPIPDRKVRYDYYEEGPFSAKALAADFGAYDPVRSVYPRARLEAASVSIDGLEIDHPSLELEDLGFVPVRYEGKVAEASRKDSLLDLRFIRLRRLRLLSGSVSEASLAAFLRDRVKGLEETRVTLEGTAAAKARIRGIPVQVELSAELPEGGGVLEARVLRAEAFGVPIPRGLLDRYGKISLDLRPNPELPFEVDAGALRIEGGRVLVGGESRAKPR
ncbi:MAG TPA: glycosyltransferase family 39 protein, partial [Elusimicrobiota bacterium]|nr:glycosyltransferase family 39 protein [Elusimicrobiota bacterium]